jgi:hypothetical protein
MAGFNPWGAVASMINQAAESRYRGGEVWLPSPDAVQAALKLVEEAWEKPNPEV